MNSAAPQSPFSGLLNELGNVPKQGSAVMGALKRAAQSTGVDFSYLVKTATRESALNPNAHAKTSSAAGLFQFVEQSWLSAIKTHGDKHGLGAYASAIIPEKGGRLGVPNHEARKEIMALRLNPDIASTMAAETTKGHAAYLKGRFGRDPSQGELYAAHFLGPAGAAELISAAQNRPNAKAASLFPDAAHSNKSIFFNDGHALNVTQVLAGLSTHLGSSPAMTGDAPTPDANEPSAYIKAKLNKLDQESALIEMVFGGDNKDATSSLFTAQLLSGFGPEKDDKTNLG